MYRRVLSVAAVAGALTLGLVSPDRFALLAQDPAPITPPVTTPTVNRSELPLADPVIDSAVELKCRRATSWTDGDAKLLYLDGDCSLAVGTYGFRAEKMVVRLDKEQRPGKVIRHVSMFLDDARPLRGRGPVQAQSPRLLVTVSTTGDIDLLTDLLRKQSAESEPLVAQAKTRFAEYLAKLNAPALDVPAGSPIMTPEMLAQRDAMREQITHDTADRAQAALAARAKAKHPEKPSTQPAPGEEGAVAATAPATQHVAQAPQTQPTTATQPGTTSVAAVAPTQTNPPATQPKAVADKKHGKSKAKPEPEPPAQAAAPGKTIAPTDASPKKTAITPADQIFAQKGTVIFGADRVVFQQGNEGENLLLLMGNVRVLYKGSDKKTPDATLTAQNAVIFLSGGNQLAQLTERQAGVEDVRGIYLEDNVVATYDQYTVRAPRVFYDLTRNRAIVLDAVMFGWDVKKQIPLYVRAQKMRQESANTWTAKNAALTNSEFGVPHFSIAARTITFKQERREDGSMAGPFTAQNITAKFGTTPIFYWPFLAGDASQSIPLQKASFGYSSNDGAKIKTTWDLFALAGQPKPSGVELSGDLDYNGRHGAGMGVNLDYDLPRQFGFFDGYFAPHDSGTDEIGGRDNVELNGDARGFALWRHRQLLPRHWELSLEFAYVSDPTFLEEYFRSRAETSKPYETSVYLKKQQEDWAFTLLAKYDLNDFVAQTPNLQSPGYNVDKLPELGYYRVATSLWNDRLTYYTENRAGLMRIRPGTDSPHDLGFNDRLSMMLFGIPSARTPFDQAAEDAGLPDSYRSRLDSRHEIQAPMKLSIFDVVPYVSGRFTGYDEDFDDFNDDSEPIRLWGAGGVRLATQFSRTYDNVDNRILDLHRMRHIIEPSADLFLMGSSVNPEDYPVYDPDVEGIQEGAGARFGLRNTLQTQRGGPGRWRDTDWLVVNTDVVLRGDDAQDETSISRFISYRPEYSLGGDHFHADVMWMVSDSLAVVGEAIQNLEDDVLAQWRAGAQLQNSPELATFVDYTEIHDLDEKLFTYGFTYDLSRKYSLTFTHTLDFSRNESRSMSVRVTRRLPRWTLIVFSSYDQIDDDTTVGMMIVPDGLFHVRAPNLFTTDRQRD
ncbi:MAG: LPS assembly protein LptD [Planctomycetes bacterium]|nr:LPS assembly protein LptD [Planctomycetota bacterium]